MGKYNIPGVTIYDQAKIVGLEHIEFSHDIIIDDFVLIYAKKKIKLGNYVHIACFTSITGGEELIVEDYSAISQGCRILTATDDFKEWGFGNSTINEKYRNVKRSPIHIGRFCIVGANSVILPGVTLGEGAMVAACSVVSRSLEPWGVYIGNKKINERNREAVLRNYESFLREKKK